MSNNKFTTAGSILEKKEKVKKVLVMGVGNLIMGDEGIGIHVIRELQKKQLRNNIDLLDGGTGGFHLISYLQEYETIVMIDASLDNFPEGTVRMIKPKFASDFPKALSAHDIGLKDLIESVSLIGKLPEIYLITVSVKELNNISIELSPAISGAVPGVISEVENILKKF